MSWNWLDVVVLLLALGQIAGLVAIGVIALRIKNGPVARAIALAKREVASGRRLAATGQEVGLKALPHLLRTKNALAKLPKSFHPVEFSDAPVTYASLLGGFSTLGAVRGLGRGVVRGSRPSAAPRRSVADRLGLLPPAWQKIAPLVGYAGTALTVWREVQAQLPEIRRRILSAQALSEDDTD